MLKELAKAFSTKSKIILLFSFAVILFTFFKLNSNIESKYDINDSKIEGTIIEKKIYENRISLVVKGKEKVLLNCYDCQDDFILGNKIKAKGRFKTPNKNTVFYLFNYQNYLKSKKINYIFDIVSYERDNSINIFYKLKNKVIARVNKLDNPYLNTFILGNNSLDENIYHTYQKNGVSHLFAISGMHISLLTLILTFILKKLIKKEFLIYSLIFTFLIFYMFLTNFSPSILRSSFLFIGLSLNKLFKWDFKAYDILLLILNILLLYNPFYIYSVSFIFSFTISFYLIIFNKLFSKVHNYFFKVFLVSLVSFLVSLPIVINNFSTINLTSPLINLISVPIISILIFPLSLLTFIFPFLSFVFSFCINKFELLSFFLSKISINLDFGHMNIVMIIGYYFLITSIFIKFKVRKVLLLTVFLFVLYNFNYFSFYPKLTFMDVGQGDATLLELPFNKGNILIDTGGNERYDLSSNTLIPYLKASGIKKLDCLIITHGDFDHMGASLELIDNFKIENVIFNSYQNNDLENQLIDKLNSKDISYQNYSKNHLNINGYKLYFLNQKHYNENEDSLIIYTKINGKNILLMGDASKTNELELLNTYDLPKIDILKVGHHGSKTSTSKNFIDTIKPKYSIISVGKNNIYGHPNREVLNILVDYKIYRTDKDGSIMFKIKNNKLKIRKCSP